MPILTSWQYYFVDIKADKEKIIRHVLDESQWLKFKDDIATWKPFVRIWATHVHNFKLEEFWELPMDSDAMEKYRILEKPIRESVDRRIKHWYRVKTLDDLRFSVALYYENTP